MCKPDAVERGLVGEIVARFERKGLTLVAAELKTADREPDEAHYDEPREKPFCGELGDYLRRGPVMAMVGEGPADNPFYVCRPHRGTPRTGQREPTRRERRSQDGSQSVVAAQYK